MDPGGVTALESVGHGARGYSGSLSLEVLAEPVGVLGYGELTFALGHEEGLDGYAVVAGQGVELR